MFSVTSSPLRSNGVDQVPHPLLIEASAGTGKTWTLAHLATRFMLEEDCAPSNLLLVTFTNEAAQSLRGRVRGHLEMVLSFLKTLTEVQKPLPSGADPWQQYFAGKSEEQVQLFLERGHRHLSNLDDIHAQTFHSFAMDYAADRSQVLASGEVEFEQAFREIIAEAALEDKANVRGDDHNIHEGEAAGEDNAQSSPDDEVGFEDLLKISLGQTSRLEALRRIAKRVFDAGYRSNLDNKTIQLLPEGREGHDRMTKLAMYQRDLVLEILERHAELLRKRNITTFSDLISNLSQRLRGPTGHVLRDEIRSQFDVVMIDEFQDTDPVQWGIFSSLFLDVPETRLIAVGDPKQSIYSFRSASVETFISVRKQCESRGVDVVTLDTNHRSDPSILKGLNSFFDGSDFHYEVEEAADPPKIPYVPVHASAEKVDGENLIGAGSKKRGPIHLRLGKGNEDAVIGEVGEYIALLQDAGQKLSSIVVLCYNNRKCNEVHRALGKRGIPSVTSADNSVFTSDAALHARVLLGALSSPERTGLSAALVATWFAPLTAAGSDITVPALVAEFQQFGVAAIVRFMRRPEVLRRVIGLREGDRHITDLLQITELMAVDCHAMRSLSLVHNWLLDAMEEDEIPESEAVRRLPTEGEAVRIMTTHAAKGLEFDTVLVPYLSANWGVPSRSGDNFELLSWLEAEKAVIDAGSGIEWGNVEERRLRSLAMVQGEYRRSAYVALTRAAHHLVVWSATQDKKPLKGEFIRMVYDRTDGEPSKVRNRSIREAEQLFESRESKNLSDVESVVKSDQAMDLARKYFESTPQIYLAEIGSGDVMSGLQKPFLPPEVNQGGGGDGPELTTPTSRVAPKVAWEKRRWSYTAISDQLKAAGQTFIDGSDEVTGGIDEERNGAQPVNAVLASVRNVFGDLAGNKLGVAVHTMLDNAVGKTSSVDEKIVYEALEANGFSPQAIESNMATIRSSVELIATRPLFGVLEGTTLQNLDATRLVSELRFTMSVGAEPMALRLANAVDVVLRDDYSGPEGRGLFHSYFANRDWSNGGATDGFLVGSMDLVVQRPDGRFYIVDYKTDQLGGAVRPYSPEAMAAVMERQHYVIQALVYSVALHRYLSRTLEGYSAEQHFGGCGYYFVRVAGDANAEPEDGFFSWRLSPDAVVNASKAMR